MYYVHVHTFVGNGIFDTTQFQSLYSMVTIKNKVINK